jgi:hypothetical protein
MSNLAAFVIGFSVTFYWRYYRRLGVWRPMVPATKRAAGR